MWYNESMPAYEEIDGEVVASYTEENAPSFSIAESDIPHEVVQSALDADPSENASLPPETPETRIRMIRLADPDLDKEWHYIQEQKLAKMPVKIGKAAIKRVSKPLERQEIKDKFRKKRASGF